MTITIKCAECGAEPEAETAPKRYEDYGAEATVQVGPCKSCVSDEKAKSFDEGKEEGLEEGRAEGEET